MVGVAQASQAINELLELGYIRCDSGSWACTQAGLKAHIVWLRDRPLGVQSVLTADPQIARTAEPAESVDLGDGLCSPDSAVESNTAKNDEAVYGGPQYINSASLSVSTGKH